MPSGTGAPGELRPSTSPLDSHSSDVTPHELTHDGLRESAFFVVANEREIAGVHHRVQILLGAWQLRRLAETAAELVGALVVAIVPYPGRQVHVRLRAYQTRMRCEVSGMYPAESAVGPAPEPGSSDGVTEVTASAGAGEPTEALYLLERDSLAWGRQEFHWGRTFWFELELGPA